MAPSFPSRRARRQAQSGGEANPVENAQAAPASEPQASSEAFADANASSRKRRRRQAETLASVVKESTPGAAMDIIRGCKPFILADGKHGAIVMVTTEALGGLSLKNRDDADKGSIIELIRADHITTLATPEMIAGKGSVEQERFGVIPTKNTLERMEEYRLLTNAKYYWAVVPLDGSLNIEEYPRADVAFRDLMLVQLGVESIDDKIETARTATPPAPAAASPSPTPDAATSEAPAAESAASLGASYAPFADDDQPFVPETSAPAAAASSEGQNAPAATGSTAVDSPPSTNTVENAPVVDDVEEEEAENEEPQEIEDDGIVVESEQVRDTIARRFFERDLNLAIDMAPFDALVAEQFEYEPYDTYDENDGDNWLMSQLNGLVLEANAEVRLVRQQHIEELRQDYIDLMTEHILNIDKKLSLSDSTTKFGQLAEVNEASHEEDLRHVDSLVAARRQELQSSYDTLLAEAEEVGRLNARNRYNNDNRSRLDRQIADLPNLITTEIDDVKNSRERALLDRRRSEAEKRLDLGATTIMNQLADRRSAQFAAENDVVTRWNDEIRSYIDEHRSEGLAFVEATRSRLAHDDEIEKKKAEFDTQMAAVKEANAERIAILTRQLEDSQSRFDAEIASREAEWASRVSASQDNAKSANDRVEALTNHIAVLKDEFEAQYAPQLAAKTHEAEVARADAQRMGSAKDQSMKIIVFLAALMVIVAVFIGALIGMSMR